MIKFQGQQVLNVDGQDALYLSYEIIGGWGRDIRDAAHHVLVDMEKQNVNIGRQAQRDEQEGIFLAAHFRFNDNDVVVHRNDTAESVRIAYLLKLDQQQQAYESSPEGIAAQAKRDRETENKTEAAHNFLESIMRLSFKYQNAGSTQQPKGSAAFELMHDLYDFIKLADDIPNTHWDQDIFLESMKRFNYVVNEHVGRPSAEFADLHTKRAYIVGQAMNWVVQEGCFHQTVLVVLERYFNDAKDDNPYQIQQTVNVVNENEKRNGGEQKNP